jgi:hypothetical protein
MASRFFTITFWRAMAIAPRERLAVTIIGSISGVRPTATERAKKKASPQLPLLTPVITNTAGAITDMQRIRSRLTWLMPRSKLVLFSTPVTAVAMEPRAALGHYDAKTDKYELWVGGGGAVRQRGELASVLGVDPKLVRVQTYDVGGNFGSKNRVYVEYGLVLWASRRVGRP